MGITHSRSRVVSLGPVYFTVRSHLIEARGQPSTVHYFYSSCSKGNFHTHEIIRPIRDKQFSFYMLFSSEHSTDFLFPAKVYFNGQFLESYFERILIVVHIKMEVCL